MRDGDYIYYCNVEGKMIITQNMDDIYDASLNDATSILGTVWKDGKLVGEFKVKMYE